MLLRAPTPNIKMGVITMKFEDAVLLVLLAGCGTAIGIAAKRQALRVGLPANVVPLLGAVAVQLVDGALQSR